MNDTISSAALDIDGRCRGIGPSNTKAPHTRVATYWALVVPVIVGLIILQFKIGYGILTGADWARLAFLIFYAIGPSVALTTVREGGKTGPLISEMLYLSGVWILAMPSSRRYFKARRAKNTKA